MTEVQLTMRFLVALLVAWFCCSDTAAFAPLRTTKHAASRGLVHFMFTGIVEEMGTVVSMEERDDMTLWDGTSGKGTELVVKGNVVLQDAYLG